MARNTAGQRMLLGATARRSRCPLRPLTYGGWDHHDNIKNAIIGPDAHFDKAYARC